MLTRSYIKYKALKVKAAGLHWMFQEVLTQVTAGEKGGDAVKTLQDMQQREQI